MNRGTFERRNDAPKRLRGRPWMRLRERVLQRDSYLCQCDECLGGQKRLRVASEVNHIKPLADGGDDGMDNLQAVNAECHTRITLEQRGIKPKQRIGLDGWPVADTDAGSALQRRNVSSHGSTAGPGDAAGGPGGG